MTMPRGRLRSTFVALDRSHGRFDILAVTDPPPSGDLPCRAFGSGDRHGCFGLSSGRTRGFTPVLSGQVQHQLDGGRVAPMRPPG